MKKLFLCYETCHGYDYMKMIIFFCVVVRGGYT